jgi:hypothetical protein
LEHNLAAGESGQLMLLVVKVLSAVGGNSDIQYGSYHFRKKKGDFYTVAFLFRSNTTLRT